MARVTDPCKIALVDPTHTSQLIANDCFPLGIGFIAAYLRKSLGLEIDLRLYKYPEAALTALREYQPDVLLLANYNWNMDLSCLIAKRAKDIRPSTLVVQGGPNFPLERSAQVRYLLAHPELDLYILGEGEIACKDLIEDFLGGDGSAGYLKKHGRLAGCAYVDDHAVVINEAKPRMVELDQIPSPYLSGDMDQFFDNQIHPLIETNRGCPFQCTFCQQGTGYFTKVRHFDVDRVKEELTYIAKKITKDSPKIRAMTMADPNFGMFERDLEIAEHIGKLQYEYKWPTFIDATTGKNVPQRVLSAIELMRGGLTVSNAVQSMDSEVLRNIKRNNIKLSAYAEIQKQIRKKGMQSKADVILGLPGETLESHLVGFKDLIEAGIQRFNSYQLMMLMGTELEVSTTRKQYNMQTMFRTLPRSFGEYGGNKAIEIEEVCVATNSLTFDDYVKARRFHLVLNIFFNEWTFQEVLEYLRTSGISPYEWLVAIAERIDTAPEEVTNLFYRYVEETKDELFDTEKEVRDFYDQPENFRQLVAGELGNNLLFGYWSQGLLSHFDAVVSYAFTQLRHCVSAAKGEITPGLASELSDLERFTRQRLVLGGVLSDHLDPTEGTFSYDFREWASQEYTKPLRFHRNAGMKLRFTLDDESRRLIRDNLSVWGKSPVGLTKMMSRTLISDFKTRVERVD